MQVQCEEELKAGASFLKCLFLVCAKPGDRQRFEIIRLELSTMETGGILSWAWGVNSTWFHFIFP